MDSDHTCRVWGALADYHGGRRPLYSFCKECGGYLKPHETELCSDCRQPGLFDEKNVDNK